MIPFIPIVAGIALGKLIYDSLKDDPDYSEINHKNIYTNLMINQDEEKLELKILKQKITRSLNKLEISYTGFKIGKSGNPRVRQASEDYSKYSGMYILCASSDSGVISSLESYYNKKYIAHKKNDNKRGGSAGVTIDSNGIHYLYSAVR